MWVAPKIGDFPPISLYIKNDYYVASEVFWFTEADMLDMLYMDSWSAYFESIMD